MGSGNAETEFFCEAGLRKAESSGSGENGEYRSREGPLSSMGAVWTLRFSGMLYLRGEARERE